MVEWIAAVEMGESRWRWWRWAVSVELVGDEAEWTRRWRWGKVDGDAAPPRRRSNRRRSNVEHFCLLATSISRRPEGAAFAKPPEGATFEGPSLSPAPEAALEGP